jgi:hypothetical protein
MHAMSSSGRPSHDPTFAGLGLVLGRRDARAVLEGMTS